MRAEKSALGKGGFNSKLEAARQVTEYGEVMIVANGRMENILPRLLDGEELGTLFAAGRQRNIIPKPLDRQRQASGNDRGG